MDLDLSAVVDLDVNSIVSKIQDTLCCGICLNTAREPLLCERCELIFCGKCISLWAQKNDTCPSRCPGPLQTKQPNRQLRQIIEIIGPDRGLARSVTTSFNSRPQRRSMTPEQITVGCMIKLMHSETKWFLHSHNIKYPSGSKRQEVTSWWFRDDNDWWLVKSPRGDNLQSGSVIVLTHVATNRNLSSSEGFKSPTTQQQEVCCVDRSAVGEEEDQWVLTVSEGDGLWRVGSVITLTHMATGRKLHSHGHVYSKRNQGEVTCFGGGDSNDNWQVNNVKKGQSNYHLY
eukprot:TRINITY_DN8946_c0_g1_i1.p1 TRINITY_DN8946_c0_g1~~TRINITY_DN8946_c0_g1_i1.p1  ORF type:complete len:287 (+),score=21.37 TRINITY_DN8946_c0_g1_i1:221-1081(+)